MDLNLLLPRTLTLASVAAIGVHLAAPAVEQLRPVSTLSSPSTIGLIKQSEGLRTRAYQDSGGVWTIGYGHTTTARPGQAITAAQAERLLRKDLQRFERVVEEAVVVPISEAQRSALVSFAFNVGEEAFKGSTLLKRLNAGDKAAAAREFQRWNKVDGRVVPGLSKRREREAELFKW